MQISDYNWKAKDGVYLFARSWSPEKSGKSTIIILHGMGEHSGRYHEWAEKFVDAGFNVMAMDSRGYGKSGGKRGVSKSYDKYINDIDLIIDKTRALFETNHIYLYGHGMGGNLAINYQLKRRPSLSGIILSAPWLRVSKYYRKARPLVNNFSKVLPRSLPVNGIKPKELTQDANEIKSHNEDPLNHYRISLKLFLEFSEFGLFALRNKHKVNLPVLILHGRKDTITSYRASQEMGRNSSNISVKIFKNCYHALHHELDRSLVFDSILKWLNIPYTQKSEDISVNH